jgi:hypothetical protein
MKVVTSDNYSTGLVKNLLQENGFELTDEGPEHQEFKDSRTGMHVLAVGDSKKSQITMRGSVVVPQGNSVTACQRLVEYLNRRDSGCCRHSVAKSGSDLVIQVDYSLPLFPFPHGFEPRVLAVEAATVCDRLLELGSRFVELATLAQQEI